MSKIEQSPKGEKRLKIISKYDGQYNCYARMEGSDKRWGWRAVVGISVAIQLMRKMEHFKWVNNIIWCKVTKITLVAMENKLQTAREFINDLLR